MAEEKLEFLVGKDYPCLCSWCRQAVDDMAILYVEGLMADTDDPEAPCMAVYDRGLYCGVTECINKGGDAAGFQERSVPAVVEELD